MIVFNSLFAGYKYDVIIIIRRKYAYISMKIFDLIK